MDGKDGHELKLPKIRLAFSRYYTFKDKNIWWLVLPYEIRKIFCAQLYRSK